MDTGPPNSAELKYNRECNYSSTYIAFNFVFYIYIYISENHHRSRRIDAFAVLGVHFIILQHFFFRVLGSTLFSINQR